MTVSELTAVFWNVLLLQDTTYETKLHNIPEVGNSEVSYVFCEVGARLLDITYMKFRLQKR
jgi:hypothetical protein